MMWTIPHHGLHGRRRVLWPLLVVRHIWTSAVVDDEAVRFNLRLLAVLTAVFSLPDLAQGLMTIAHMTGGERLYGMYVTLLGLAELSGALLLARRHAAGRPLILAAAVGFYVEVGLGLAGFERNLLAVTIFAVCIPAEAWVIWFVRHPRVRRLLRAGTEARPSTAPE